MLTFYKHLNRDSCLSLLRGQRQHAVTLRSPRNSLNFLETSTKTKLKFVSLGHKRISGIDSRLKAGVLLKIILMNTFSRRLRERHTQVWELAPSGRATINCFKLVMCVCVCV